MTSFSTPEYAVRKIVSAISSAIENSVFLKSSKAMGSWPFVVMASSRDLDHDVAVRIQPRGRGRRNHARRVVFLHDRRTGDGLHQITARQDRCVAPAVLLSKVDGPARGRASGRGAVDDDALGHARSIGHAVRDETQAHEVDGLVSARAVPVHTLVLP